MISKQKRISAVLLSLLLCSCSVKTGGSDDSSAVPAAVSTSVQTTAAPEQPLPESIEGFKGDTDKISFKLKWTPVKGVDGYELLLRPANGSRTENYFVSPDECKYTVTNRENGECAFFIVRAFVRKGAELEYTAQSKEIRLTTMRDKHSLTVSNVCQYSKPALPTGCECAALTSLLRHCGFNITKNEIAADYLEKVPFEEKKIKGKKGKTQLYGADPNEAFPGDPAEENSYGCYAKPLVNAANKYLATQDTTLRAKDLTGHKLSSLYKYINNGSPVVVWATQELKPSKKTDKWLTKEGKEITWLKNEHCLVLIGYDTDLGVLYCSDPSKRDVAPQRFDAKLFEKRYKEQGSHAVVIE